MARDGKSGRDTADAPSASDPVRALDLPNLRRVLAANPGPLTGSGTNTWIVGRGAVAVIDPGPPHDPAHVRAILAALSADEKVSHILVTHAHLDHSGAASALAAVTGAPVLGQPAPPPSPATGIGGGEGRDPTFRPDVALVGGETVAGMGWRLRVLHTPGHFPGHLAFDWDGIVFTGDLVMGWASTLISPPDGDLAAFRRSVALLRDRNARLFLPGHGNPVRDPSARAQALLDHRAAREAAILATLAEGPATIPDLVARLYAETPQHLHGAAARNVLAHLLDLSRRSGVVSSPAPGPAAVWSVAPPGDPV